MRFHPFSLFLPLALLWPAASHAAGAIDVLGWLLSPMSGASDHRISNLTAWHARLMVLGWGVLLPLGALAARFFKVMPGQDWPRHLDNPAWWHAHRALQYAGVIAMTAGLAMAIGLGDGRNTAARIHAYIGWGLCVAGWLQVAGGICRGTKGGPTEPDLRGDHYDMTHWRTAFERLHKTLGWLAIVFAPVAISLGLAIVDAPRWMALALGLWWLALAIVSLGLQRQGRCIDTYQAIWGPDSAHPGNRRSVVGWGVRRYTGSESDERASARAERANP